MVHVPKTNYLWSAGRPPRVAQPSERESQLTFLCPDAPTQTMSFFVKGQVSGLCAQGDAVWAAFEDGLLMSFNSSSGEKLWTVTKFQSEAGTPVHVSLAATPVLERLWATDGYAMYFYEGDGVFSVIDSRALSPQTSFVSQAARASGNSVSWSGGEGSGEGKEKDADDNEIEEEEKEDEEEDKEKERKNVWEEMVASASEDGTVCLWNGTDKSCDVAQLQGPKAPLLLVGSCEESIWVAVGNESVSVFVYNNK